MKALITIIVSLLASSSSFAGKPLIEPQVINTSKAQEIHLGKDVEQALVNFDQNFKVLEFQNFLGPILGTFESYPNELPQAVSDDFNGDGIKDLLLMGLTQEKKSIVVKALLLVSSKKGYQVIPLDQWPTSLPRGMSTESAMERLENWEIYLSLTEPIEVKNTNVPNDRRAFKVEAYLKQVHLYYYKDGTIKKPLRRYSNSDL